MRLARRETMAIARMSIAVLFSFERDRIQEMRISLGAVTPTPHRMSEAESLCTGQTPSDDLLRMVSGKISESVIRWSGIRPSTSYKRPVMESLFLRAFHKAMEGAG